MTHDDAFIGLLRDLAGPTPGLTVDRARVVARGRRRRAARGGAVAAATVAVVVATWTGVAALAGPEDDPAPPAGPTAAGAVTTPSGAVVDEGAGTITLPFDGLHLSPAERALVETAHELHVADCMADRGLADAYPFLGPVEANGVDVRYGVWREVDVRARGYTEVRLAEPRQHVLPSHTSQIDAALVTCEEAAADAGLAYGPEDFEDVPAVATESATQSDDGRAVIAEWSACLRANGVRPPLEVWPLLPADVEAMSFDEQVRVGLVDVACKREHDVIRRLAELDAGFQKETLQHGREYVLRVQQVEQSLYANAVALLEERGVAMD